MPGPAGEERVICGSGYGRAMTTIFLDTDALAIPSHPESGDAYVLSRESDRMVGHLLDCGHRVVLVGEPDQLEKARATLTVGSKTATLVPDPTAAGVPEDARGWLITESPEACAAVREKRRLRTILVGGSSDPNDLAHRPADLLARSLSDAVIEILATEAMPEAATR